MGKVKSQRKEKMRPKRGHHCLWTESMMSSAIAAVREQGVSQRAACKMYAVPRCTLQMRLNGKTEEGSKPGRPTMLSYDLEEKLVDYACNRATMGIGFGRQQFMKYAGSLAQKHKVHFKRGQPSSRWWRGVKRRHDRLKLRQPEGTAAVRHQCMDATKVSKYFEALENTINAANLQDRPHCIWNMDETGVQFDHKPGKIVAAKGSKYLHSRTSGNRETITIIGAVSASGQHIPPHMIVKGQTRRSLNSFQTETAPEGSTWSWSDSGWTKQGIALLWFTKSFLPNIGDERPQLLILDGHDSHNFVELIDVAVENNVHIIELPAHTSNWLQPCDRTVFGPFKNAYRKACEELSSSFPGTVVSKSNFCGLLKKAWDDAVTPINIRSGFRACGIYPFNPQAIPSEAFIPNSLYAARAENEINEQDGSVIEETVISAISDVVMEQNASEMSNHVTPGCTSSDQHQDIVTISTSTPEIALSQLEANCLPEQLECFKFCLARNYDLVSDSVYMLWKSLKLLSAGDTSAVGSTDCLIDITDYSVSTVANITASVDNALPDLDVSVTDHLTNCLDELERTQDMADPAQQADTSSSLTAVNENLPIHECPSKPGCVNGGSVLVNQAQCNKFPFNNSSHPGDEDADILPYPEKISRKSSKQHKQKYFLITSKEAREAKLKDVQDKLEREASKKAKAEVKARKREEKVKTGNSKSNQSTSVDHPVKPTIASRKQKAGKKSACDKKNTKRSDVANKATEDTVPCSVCFVRFCDDTSGRQWIQCQKCRLWYHNECQGLDERGVITFKCIQCDE